MFIDNKYHDTHNRTARLTAPLRLLLLAAVLALLILPAGKNVSAENDKKAENVAYAV